MFSWLRQQWTQWRKPVDPRHAAGRRAERWAAKHLQRQGLRLLARNFHCKNGELDLVMRDGEYLIFVEVRYREHGGALESVRYTKQQHVIHCAEHYLRTHQYTERQARRFDLVLIQGDLRQPELEWIQDAFRQ